MSGGCTKQSNSSVAAADIKTDICQIKDEAGGKLPKIYKQEVKIRSLQTQIEQLRGLLDPTFLVDALSQAVTTSLRVNSQPVTKGGLWENRLGT